MTNGLVLDLGTDTAGVAVVGEQGTWIVPDPSSRESRWRCVVHWDGMRVAVGAHAEHRRLTDPAGYAAGFKRGLDQDVPVTLGARRFRPVELLSELVSAMRVEALRLYGATDRALVTIPSSWVPGDPRRARVLAATEAAGFTAVELLAEAVAASCAPWPGPPFAPGDFVLVYDLGATFEATLVRVGADYHEIVGHATIDDIAAREAGASLSSAHVAGASLSSAHVAGASLSSAHVAGASLSSAVVSGARIDLTVASCRDVLGRLNLRTEDLAAVLAVGGGCRAPGLAAVLERGLGAPVRRVDEPDLVVLRGAAHWLPRSGARTVPAPAPAHRLVPLSFTIPGGSAQLLRWLVPARQPYDEGTTLARIRLTGGAVWELTARARGMLDQILVGDGAPVSSGEWLALARH